MLLCTLVLRGALVTICVHLQVVLEVAMSASSENRPATLAVVYDELVRKEIENKCGQLGTSWKFQEMLVRLDERTLRAARKLVPELKEEVRVQLFCKCVAALIPYLGCLQKRELGAARAWQSQPQTKGAWQSQPQTKGRGKAASLQRGGAPSWAAQPSTPKGETPVCVVHA